MTASTYVATLVLALLSAAPGLQQPATASAQQATPGAGIVTLTGCVERLASTPGAGANAAPAFKLIEVQPGAGTRMSLRVDSQFLLVTSKSPNTSIDLGKFQNQRVEVIGAISPTSPAAVSPTARPETAPTPPPTLTVTSLKVVSTECK